MASVVNVSTTFSADIVNYIQKKVMPLVQRQLVFYQFGDALRLPKGRGTTYTGSRFDRLNLPFAPLSEGVPPAGESLPLAQVQAVAQQWGDKVTITDVAELTIYHNLFQQAIKLTAMALKETLDRNTANALMGGTQVNYVNSRGARASLVAGDVLNPHEVDRLYAQLFTIGAPQYDGTMEEDQMVEAGKPTKASESWRGQPHYVAICHPFVEQDMRENPTVATAWSYSDINRLYNNELGIWGGARWCRSNLVPSWTGIAQTNVSSNSTQGGTFAANTYYIQVTGSNSQNGYESQIYQISTSTTTTGSTSSINVTMPSTAGYVYNVYVGTSATSMTTLALSPSGPTTGPLAGQAVQIPASTVVTLTGTGAAQVPPAAPATGLTVYPTFFLGRSAYGQVMLDDPQFFYLRDADKSDPNNQLRVISWKVMYGTLIQNNQFFARVESVTGFTAAFG